MTTIDARAARSLNPPEVARALGGIAANAGDSFETLLRDFPLGDDALLHLLAVSPICAERLQRDPGLLPWLAQAEISGADRGPRRMMAELRNFADEPAAENFRALRRWKGREMTRIALREVAGVASLEETTRELSYLAEVCLAVVLDHLVAQLRTRYGSPSANFTVLGLGKLGGHELNHSSDIDLIIFYEHEGDVSPRVTNHVWFNRLAENLVKIFNAHDPAGALFRVDLRLRPEGTAGPLTRSLESAENYYAGFGETWERLALIKARGVAGSEELAYEFLRQHQPFIFPRSPTPELLDEMAAIKRRIEREVPFEELNVKLGAGGIREIEFVTQTLQFIHGARHAFLQDSSTIKALHAIAELELLPRDDVGTLEHAYRFLRRVEHRRQIENEQQTHSLPPDLAGRNLLARSLGFADDAELTQELQRTMRSVREIFTRVIASEHNHGTIKLDFFADPPRAEKTLAEMVKSSASFHIAPRTRQIFQTLRPLLVAELTRVADPDNTLIALLRFVEAFGMRSLLFELLAANPRLLELLVQTFDQSDFGAQLLIRSPNLLQEITRSPDFDRSRTLAHHQEWLTAAVKDRRLDGIRDYRQRQLLRTILRDVLGLVDLRTLLRELSALAEGCLLAVNDIAGSEKLTIVAMGKFGGRELGYGSDLDLMFVGDDHRAAQNLANTLAASSPLGQIANVDLRLRPEGDKGPLVAPLESFANYYRDRAQLWELQALTRSRVITGPDRTAFYEIAHAASANAGRDDHLFSKIDAMLQRIRQERGVTNDFLNFKTGVGGLIEAEFLIQGLQMHHNLREVSTMSAIQKLAAVLTPTDANRLSDAYEFLRTCEITLRRRENKGVDTLPSGKTELTRLAQRMDSETLGTWRARYQAARDDIHSIYKRHFGSRIS